MENDHDYVASGSGNRSSNDEATTEENNYQIPAGRRRRILQLTTQRLAALSNNSDHNYVFAPVSSGASVSSTSSSSTSYSSTGSNNSSVSTGGSIIRIDADSDLFEDDDDDEDDERRDVPAVPANLGEDSETDSIETVSNPWVSAAEAESDSTNASEATNNSGATVHTGEVANVPTVAEVPEEPELPTPAVPLETNESLVDLSSPSPPKKRKRLSLEPTNKVGTPKVKSEDADEEDDGLTCPICLDNWEMSGEHRLSSLKCGHLFGESCIRRWLQESARQSGIKVCPQCKTKAHPKDIRYLYAKRLRAIDRSEEHRMRDLLNQERSKSQTLELELATMKMSYAQVTQKIKTLESDNETLKRLMRKGGPNVYNSSGALDGAKRFRNSVSYKLFMEKNIELSREPGCRVMTFADVHSALIVSQKSSQGLFPGYGLRFVDTPTFKPSNFLHTSIKMVRDLSLSEDQQLLVVASMEQKAKLFDLRTLQAVTTFKPAEKPLWSCSIARRENENYLYLGSQHGCTYVYDIRYPETFIDEHQTEGDCSPVIQVASVAESELFPCGGFIICKLTSLWFYENLQGGGVNATRLSVEGRLISMSYDSNNHTLLVQTRSCQRYHRARHILGNLNKIDCIPVFEMKVTFYASTNSPVMVRSTQIAVDSNTLVAAYIQDTKLLSMFDANSEQCVQSLPVQEVVYDLCPVYTKDFTYLAGLTETKCRLYKLNSTTS